MYASMLTINLGPGMRSAAEKLVEQFAPAMKTMKGFKGVTFLADDTTGEYVSLTLWESKEDREAAIAVLDPKLKQATLVISRILKGAPTRKLFEVYETKG